MWALIGLLLLQISSLGGFFQPTTVISSLAKSVDASTVVLSWTTDIVSDTRASCGSEKSPDNGIAPASTSHSIVVAGLSASTAYTCIAQSGATTATIAATTTAAAASTPITGLSFGTFIDYNATAVNPMNGDTLYNFKSNDGITYVGVADTGFGCSGLGNFQAQILCKFSSESPLTLANVNTLTAYGPCCSLTSQADGKSPKSQGMIGLAGNIFMTLQRTNENNAPVQYQYAGSIIMTTDHGVTFNNMQTPGTFYTTGQEMSPVSTSFANFNEISTPPFNFSTNTFVVYGADDGTLGYTVAANRFDNGNAYVYLVSGGIGSGSGSTWNNGDAFYLVRVPRSKIARLNPTDYQFYVGSGDGSLDSNWTSSISGAGAFLTNTGKLSIPNMQYIPALNRYLMMTFYYPSPTVTANASWLGYDCVKPWGPCTQIFTQNFPTTGYYNPVIQQDTALAAGFSPTTMTLLFNVDYGGSQGTNRMFYSTMTVAH